MEKQDVAKYIGRQIRRRRIIKDLTQKELGELIGVKHNTISAYETGVNRPGNNILFAIANVLGVSVDDLFPEGETKKAITLLPIYKKGDGQKEVEGYEPAPRMWIEDGGREYFFLKAPDFSMASSRIHEGDLLLVRAQDTVNDGEIAALIMDNQLLIRKVFHQGDQFILQSGTDRFPPILAPKEVRIIGKVKRNVIKF